MSETSKQAIWWIRRDLRLADNAALCAAAAEGAVVPVFIYESRVEALGSAALWRLEQGLVALATALEAKGSRLVLRRGKPLDVLRDILAETKAESLHWNRLYDPVSREIDAEIKANLRAAGYQAQSHTGHLLHEPMSVANQQGRYFKVFTPFWRNIAARHVAPPQPEPELPAPKHWPRSEALADWAMATGMRRGADVLAKYTKSGEAAAWAKLSEFIEHRAEGYKAQRDAPGAAGTSELSEHLSLGEISPRAVWDMCQRAQAAGGEGLEPFMRQIGWRDFAHHLMFHTPHMLRDNWREGWGSFPWSEDENHAHVQAWKEGRTGIDFVDAAMREMWVTGRMHNRARMVAASYLTKHLMVHWRVGERWFADQLIDFDPACNAMGWQWVAGSGPDAAPYFRVFNPDTQLEKFDNKGTYKKRWIAEEQTKPPQSALDFFEAVPLSAQMSPSQLRPAPIVTLKEGRERALAAYSAR